jgi:hypothetical protein
LEQPDVGGVHVDAALAALGAVEHGPHEAEAGSFAGQPADDLEGLL